VNWRHFQAIVWLRWRLLRNQWRRAGALNAVLMMVVALAALLTAIPLFIGSYVLGMYAIPKATPVQLMYVWDGVIVAFLFFWGIGLITELQRTEPLALSKLMHLPISVNGAFLINYLSSLLRLSLIIFGPMMLGYSLALVMTKGWSLLPVIPSMLAFLLMVTALTYQFQGWLAALMSNPRRRRTVVVLTTATFVLLAQLPNLLNFIGPWSVQRRANQSADLARELSNLDQTAKGKEFDAIEHVRRQQELIAKHKAADRQADRETEERMAQSARLFNLVLPVGWLPLGVTAGAEGNVVPALLGLLGMTAIGAGSLFRAYRTTVGLYHGVAASRQPRPAPAIALPASGRKRRGLLLEAHVPGLSEPVSAIALGGLRSLMRSPEAKMMLLTPLIMSVIFGGMLLKTGRTIPVSIRPLIAIGAMVSVLLGVLQLMFNQFGFDRDGFRVFVLCAAPRRDILLGKNLAFGPIALGLGAILLVIVQAVCPMRLDHILAMIPTYISMYLLFCLLTNFLSIYAPLYVAAGSLKASSPKLVTALVQMAVFTFVFPLTQGLTMLPLGIEALLVFLGWPAAVPIFLILSLAECVIVVVAYHYTLLGQGILLQAREQKILDVVTNRAA
jgi:hypothetical protein